VRGEQVALGIDRMGGKIETEGVALGGHSLGQSPSSAARQADRFRRLLFPRPAEQAVLAAGALIVGRCGTA
jgi:hypothetical protein